MAEPTGFLVNRIGLLQFCTKGAEDLHGNPDTEQEHSQDQQNIQHDNPFNSRLGWKNSVALICKR